MKNIVTKLVGLVFLFSVCILCTTCNKTEQEKEPKIHVGIDNRCYTNIIKCATNSQFQVGDSLYFFDSIEGIYCNNYLFQKNVFEIELVNSLRSVQIDSLSIYKNDKVWLSIFTKMMEPEVFFQKGIWEIDTLGISSNGINKRHFGIHAVFIWDTVFYEDRMFKGKGSLEIMETLYTNNPNIYYPPQKIEFEFK